MAENNAGVFEGQEKGSSPPGQNVPRQATAKVRHVIWTGLLEWHEKQQGPPEGQKIPRQVPCQVSANGTVGEPEVKSDGWPPKLIMQLIPKAIVGSLGGRYFRDVKTVLFMLQNCDALASLTRIMDSGFAGCVHFTGTSMQADCAIKVLILLYSKERHAYLGFIPNDQAGFVDRIRKVIQQQKTDQAVMRQGQEPMLPLGQPGGPNMGMGRPNICQFMQQPHIPNMPFGNEQQSMSQQMLQYNLQQAGAQPQLQQPEQQQQQQHVQAAILQERERRWNLMKIQELQQTLEAAQAKELQFQPMDRQPGPGHSHSPQHGMNSQGPVNQPRMASPQRMLRPSGVQRRNPGDINLVHTALTEQELEDLKSFYESFVML